MTTGYGERIQVRKSWVTPKVTPEFFAAFRNRTTRYGPPNLVDQQEKGSAAPFSAPKTISSRRTSRQFAAWRGRAALRSDELSRTRSLRLDRRVRERRGVADASGRRGHRLLFVPLADDGRRVYGVGRIGWHHARDLPACRVATPRYSGAIPHRRALPATKNPRPKWHNYLRDRALGHECPGTSSSRYFWIKAA